MSKIDPLKMAALAQQLGIRIDTFRIGEVEHLNIMKRISEITNGKYNYATDTPSLLKIAESFGDNRVETPLIAYQRGRGISKVLKKIAVPMFSEEEMNKGDDTQQDQIARLRGTKAYQKCAICFSDKDPMTKGAFNISGRYCPNCGQPLHMACAGMWAKNNDMESDGTVFRCPRCLYLISIPASVQTAQKMYQEVKQELRLQKAEATGEQSFPVREVIASQLGEQALYNACPICDAIFEENEPVVKCGNPLCNAIYHKKCFASLSDKHCKTCATRMNEIK
jgi:hypothetical protein